MLFSLLWFASVKAQQEEPIYRLELGGGVGWNMNFTDEKDK